MPIHEWMRVIVTLAATALALIVGGATASASAYPPVTRSVTASPSTGLPGYAITVTARCASGETVRIELGANTVDVACRAVDDAGRSEADADLTGEAAATLDAPTTPGAYRGTADGTTSGHLGGFVVRVDAAAALSTSTQLSDDLGIEWVEVFRSASVGTMVVAFFAATLLLRRRYTFV
jgi:hypothetical protein